MRYTRRIVSACIVCLVLVCEPDSGDTAIKHAHSWGLIEFGELDPMQQATFELYFEQTLGPAEEETRGGWTLVIELLEEAVGTIEDAPPEMERDFPGEYERIAFHSGYPWSFWLGIARIAEIHARLDVEPEGELGRVIGEMEDVFRSLMLPADVQF